MAILRACFGKQDIIPAIRSMQCCNRLSTFNLQELPWMKPVCVHQEVCNAITSFCFYVFIDYAALHQTADTYQVALNSALKSKNKFTFSVKKYCVLLRNL